MTGGELPLEFTPPPAPTPPALTPVCTVGLPGYAVELAWRPDGAGLAVACADGRAWAFELPVPGVEDALEPLAVAHHEGGCTNVAYTPDGLLASCGQDGRVVLGTGAAVAIGGWLERLAWRPDGDILAVAADSIVRLLGRDASEIAQGLPMPATIECLAFHPTGDYVAAGGYGGVRVFDAETAEEIQVLEAPGNHLELAFSPDGLSLAAGSQNEMVVVWDLASGGRQELAGFDRKVRELAWRVDSAWLAGGGGPSVSIFTFPEGVAEGFDQRIQLPAHAKAASWLAFRPGAALLASSAGDGYLFLWNLPEVAQPWAAATLGEPVTCGAWSPDGSLIAIGGTGGKVAVFAVATPPAARRRAIRPAGGDAETAEGLLADDDGISTAEAPPEAAQPD